MKIRGQQRQILSAKESYYMDKKVLSAFESVSDGKVRVTTSSEHKQGDRDRDFYGYATVEHPKLGEFIFSFNTRTGEIQEEGYPWEFLEEGDYALSNEQKVWLRNVGSQLRKRLERGEPIFEIYEGENEVKKFNPSHLDFNRGDKFKFLEDVYYFDFGTADENEEDNLTKEELIAKYKSMGLEFDEQEDMFYFPNGTVAELVNVSGPGAGWPVLRINGEDYDFAGDEFDVSVDSRTHAAGEDLQKKAASEDSPFDDFDEYDDYDDDDSELWYNGDYDERIKYLIADIDNKGLLNEFIHILKSNFEINELDGDDDYTQELIIKHGGQKGDRVYLVGDTIFILTDGEKDVFAVDQGHPTETIYSLWSNASMRKFLDSHGLVQGRDEDEDEYDADHAAEWSERHPHGYYNDEIDYGVDADEEDE